MQNHETIPVGSVKQKFFPSTWNLQIQARNTDTTLAIDQHQGFLDLVPKHVEANIRDYTPQEMCNANRNTLDYPRIAHSCW